MANHKRGRAKHQRSGCLSCKPYKDDRGKNGIQNQTLQERRLQAGVKVDGVELAPPDHDEPDVPRCAHCKGEVCTYEDCEDHTEDCELADGRWTCSRVCYDAVVEPDFLDELIAKREAVSPGFAKRVDEAYARRVGRRDTRSTQ